jgi:hypothetical protein
VYILSKLLEMCVNIYVFCGTELLEDSVMWRASGGGRKRQEVGELHRAVGLLVRKYCEQCQVKQGETEVHVARIAVGS